MRNGDGGCRADRYKTGLLRLLKPAGRLPDVTHTGACLRKYMSDCKRRFHGFRLVVVLLLNGKNSKNATAQRSTPGLFFFSYQHRGKKQVVAYHP